MAPEQIRGASVDPRTDLYALGVMLFELAVGRPPFEGSDLTELLRQHLQEAPPDAALLAPDLQLPFTRLLARLLEKDLGNRPGSAADVIEALKGVAVF
jgi:serine/threonine protein kinase